MALDIFHELKYTPKMKFEEKKLDYADSDESSKSYSEAAIQAQLNSATNSPIHNLQSNTNNLINNNSSNSTNSAIGNLNNSTVQLGGLRSNEVHTVILNDVPIIALVMDGSERLCLAQISNTLLKNYSYNEIHNRRVALGITCVQCTPVQLELLRRAGAMPVSSRRCGMITKREAERLCNSFLMEAQPPSLPENYEFRVYHKCSYGCEGFFMPSRYNSSRAKCIKCRFCGLFFSPNKFIFHSERSANSTFVHPDAANFNSWRRHIKLMDGASEKEINDWEEVKAMFNGGSRKRAMSATLNSISKQEQLQKQQLSRTLASNSLAQIANKMLPSTVSGFNSTHSNRTHKNVRGSNTDFQSNKSRISKLIDHDDEDEELVVDDYKPSVLQSNTRNINLFNNSLFASPTNLPINSHVENDLKSRPPINEFISSVSSHNNKLQLNQNHSLNAAFPHFQTANNSISGNCLNDFAIPNNQVNGSNNQQRTSNSSLTINLNMNRSPAATNGQMDVVQAMLPILGQEFVWPTHHPLNSLTQFSSLNSNHCSPNLPNTSNTTHLNTLLPNQSVNTLNNFPSKVPFSNAAAASLYNTHLTFPFAHPNNLSNNIANQVSSFNSNHQTQSNNHTKTGTTDNWLITNVEAATNQFRKVNTNKIRCEESQFSKKALPPLSPQNVTCNDFNIENLSRGKKCKPSVEMKKIKDDENVDIEGDEEEVTRRQNLIRKRINDSRDKNTSVSGQKLDINSKNKSNEKITQKKKLNCTNSLDGAERLTEGWQDGDYSVGSQLPVRSRSAGELKVEYSPVKNEMIQDRNYHNDKFQSSDCECVRNQSNNSSPNSKLIDLANADSLIQADREIKMTNGKEMDLVNNIMAISKLNEVINNNYSNDILFREEIEKRIQLFQYITNSINNVNKSEYVQKLS